MLIGISDCGSKEGGCLLGGVFAMKGTENNQLGVAQQYVPLAPVLSVSGTSGKNNL